jgi:hypothetical protein
MTSYNPRFFIILYSLLLGLGGISTFCLLSGTQSYAPLDGAPLFAYSLRYSLPIAMVAIGFLYLSFGRPLFCPPHRWPVVFGTTLSILVIGAAGVYQCNGRADLAEPNIQTVPILDKRRLYARGTKTHYVVIKSWRTGRKEERIEITEKEFKSLALPAKVTFNLMPGKLKHPWVASYSLNAL